MHHYVLVNKVGDPKICDEAISCLQGRSRAARLHLNVNLLSFSEINMKNLGN
jgi:hypothetical protein